MKFTIPGVWDQHLRHDTDLLREEPSLGAAFAARRSVRAGFGYRVYIDLTPEDARQLADHIEGQCELEMQIAGGAGDGASTSLIRTGPAVAENLRNV